MNIAEIWETNKTRGTKTTKNTAFCSTISKLGVKYVRNQSVCILQPTPKPLIYFNPLNAELNPICHLLALLGAHHILHVSRIRVNIIISIHITYPMTMHQADSIWK